MSATSFIGKALRTTFTLGSGGIATFPAGGNTLQLTGLRTIASLQGAFNFLNQLDLQVYGMTLQDMNALSVISGWQGNPTSIGKNYVLLESSQNAGKSWTTLFYGLIVEGGPILQGMPETYFHCQAIPALYLLGKQALTNANGVGGLSFPDGATVQQAAQAIATPMGADVQTNGVIGTIPKGAYLAGAPLDMLRKLPQLAGGTFSVTYDAGSPGSTTGVVAFIPKNGSRSQPSGVTLTPSNGLVGFPTIETMGIGVVALFDPALLIGAELQIADSQITAANGTWVPYQQSLQLEALALGASQWFADMKCSPVNA